MQMTRAAVVFGDFSTDEALGFQAVDHTTGGGAIKGDRGGKTGLIETWAAGDDGQRGELH